ncbi:glycoside hydrolase family protein [Oryzomicrobium terrae]|nr:glycoside hydrolase family protein [Oryzomicrobium terrae]
MLILGLSLSAAGLVATVSNEGYTDTAVIPVKGDVPTNGFGSTRREDGSPVQLGDRTTPPRAIRRAMRDMREFEGSLKKCMGDVELFQHEYDAYVDLAYNVGGAAVCKSSIPRKLQAEQYEAACRTILDFRKAQGRDCSLPENRRICGGIWTRRQEMAHLCLTGEYPS